jgi:hypothetical protein
MTLSRSNRRTTDRITRNNDDASSDRSSSRRTKSPSQAKAVEPEEKPKASGSISKRAPAASSQRKPVEEISKPNISSSSKRSPAPQLPPKAEPVSSVVKKTSASLPSKSSTSATSTKSEKELPVSSISKRQPVIPATEVKKASARIPISDPNKGSTKIPIKPVASSASASARRSSSMETTITKAPNSLSSRKIVPGANEQPDEPVKNPSKRSRTSVSGQKSGRSGKSAPKRASMAGNNNIIYGALGAILLILIILIITKASGGNQPQKTIIKNNNLDNGIALCQKARDTVRSDESKAAEALEYLEQGLALMNSALDPMRDAQNNLPVNMRGHDETLTKWTSYRKDLKNQAFIESAKKERNGK